MILVDSDCQTDDFNWVFAKEEEIYVYKLEIMKLKEENHALQKKMKGLIEEVTQYYNSAESWKMMCTN